MAVTDKNTMAFQGDFDLGAAMNPCVRWSSCRTEPVKDWRKAAKFFWGSAPAAINIAPETCTAAPTGFSSHVGADFVGSCSFQPCCTYTSRRSLLFGMPTDSSGSCDANC